MALAVATSARKSGAIRVNASSGPMRIDKAGALVIDLSQAKDARGDLLVFTGTFRGVPIFGVVSPTGADQALLDLWAVPIGSSTPVPVPSSFALQITLSGLFCEEGAAVGGAIIGMACTKIPNPIGAGACTLIAAMASAAVCELENVTFGIGGVAIDDKDCVSNPVKPKGCDITFQSTYWQPPSTASIMIEWLNGASVAETSICSYTYSSGSTDCFRFSPHPTTECIPVPGQPECQPAGEWLNQATIVSDQFDCNSTWTALATVVVTFQDGQQGAFTDTPSPIRCP